MTTLLDKKRSATSSVRSPDEAAIDQVLSRIAALAPMVARLAPDIEQGRRLPEELVSALKSAGIYGMGCNLNRRRPHWTNGGQGVGTDVKETSEAFEKNVLCNPVSWRPKREFDDVQ